jgi:hypothetical protein
MQYDILTSSPKKPKPDPMVGPAHADRSSSN